MSYSLQPRKFISPARFQSVHVMQDAPWAFELFFLFSLLLLLEFVLPGSVRLASMTPHPFWLPVILLSVQYGTGGGLAAALTAIGISWVIGWPDQAGGEDFYDYARRIWGQPMLWLGASIILGGLRSQHLYTLDVLRNELADADEQRKQIGALCTTLNSRCEHLERRMVCERDRSIEAGLAVLADVRNSEPKNLPDALGAAVALLLGQATYAVLLYRDGRLSERSDFTPAGDFAGNAPGVTKLPTVLEDALVHGKRYLSIMREDDACLLSGTALFAAPIVSPGRDRVLGVFLIQSMDASRIGQDVERSFHAVCRELAHAVARELVVMNFARNRNPVRNAQARSGKQLRNGWATREERLAGAIERTPIVEPVVIGGTRRRAQSHGNAGPDARG